MEDQNKMNETGPVRQPERKASAIVVEQSSQPAQSEGRTPIVINGCNNNITVIERQYNDRASADTVKTMLAADKAQGEMVQELVGKIFEIGSMFLPKKAAVEPRTQETPKETVKGPIATPVNSQEEIRRAERNKQQRERRAAKKAPVKKAAAKKAPAKKSVKK